MTSRPIWMRALHILVPLALALSWSVAYLSHQLGNLDELFDSDGLTLELMWVDIIQNGNRWADWYPPHAPRFLPDMALYFGLRSFSPDEYWTIFWFGLAMLYLVYFPALWLAKVLGRSPGAVLFTQVTFLATVGFVALQGDRPYSFLYAATFHTGILIHGLLLAVFHTYLRRDPSRIWPWASIALLAFLGAGSDLLFVIIYLAPFLLVLVIDRLTGGSKGEIKLVPLVAVSAVLGLFLKNQVVRDTTPAFFDFSNSLEKLWTIPATFVGMFERNPILSLLCFSFYVLITVQLVGWMRGKLRREATENSPLPFWQLTYLLSACVLLTALAVRGLFEPHYVPDIKDSRLLISIVFNAILVPWLPLQEAVKRERVLKPLGIVAWIAVVGIALQANPFNREFKTEYRPPWIEQLDARLSEYEERTGRKLDHGVATYWPTKATMALSRHELAIGQHTASLEKYYCLNNTQWYYPRYDFAIIDYTDEDKLFYQNILKASGSPEEVFRCDNLMLAVFPPDQLTAENFLVDVWKMRPASSTKRMPDDTLFSPADKEGDQIVIFGPYARLKKGRYALHLEFRIGEQLSKRRVRVEVFFSEQEEVAVVEDLEPAPSGSPIAMDLEFEVTKEKAFSPVEFRIWKDGPFELTLRKIELEAR